MRTFLALAVACLWCHPATATYKKLYKNDQYPDDAVSTADQLKSAKAEPGFVQGEAFGILVKPGLNDYPVKILGIQLFLGAPPGDATLKTKGTIEVYFDEQAAATPASSKPIWSISTTDIFNQDAGAFGVDLKGNVALELGFDWDDAAGHPPLVTGGVFRVVVRFTEPSATLDSPWGTPKCAKELAADLCGCQPVAVLFDSAVTSGANVMHLTAPLGACSGSQSWFFAENVGVKGDIMLRVLAEVSGEPTTTCTPQCAGKVCGSDGCGSVCGQCGGGQVCQGGACVNGGCNPQCVGKQCGDDLCGGVCGVCGGTQSCVSGHCADVTCIPVCAGKACGDDKCGGSCGQCTKGLTCTNGQCGAAGCIVVCTGKDCGDDGCGGTCGTCSVSASCVSGKCVAGTPGASGALAAAAMTPDSGFNDQPTEVSIVGTGFAPGLVARLGGTALGGLQVTGSTLVTALVPKGLDAGRYGLVLANVDGQTAFLPNAFEVRVRLSGCGDGTCGADESCATCAKDCGACPPQDKGCQSSDGPASRGWTSAGLPWLLGLLGLVALWRRTRSRLRDESP